MDLTGEHFDYSRRGAPRRYDKGGIYCTRCAEWLLSDEVNWDVDVLRCKYCNRQVRTGPVSEGGVRRAGWRARERKRVARKRDVGV